GAPRTSLLHAGIASPAELRSAIQPQRAHPIPALLRFFHDPLHKRVQRTEQGGSMGLGVGIFLVAVGAILAFAVHATTSAVNVHTVGWILMAVGLVSILLSLLFWSTWAGPGYWSSRRRTTYVDDGPPPY